ncbi:MAG: sigma-70 family RNA polymerase sigma factor [Muribaculaceae bacterium]|nr:sigma-70 family RNA polymerase sigma factor [Muribaculaceae bacterium]
MGIERLIEQCRQGDKEALGILYKTYAQRMRGICQRYVSDSHAVDDVLHDAFIVIFTSFDRLRNEEKAEAWMAGIVRNVALKHSKRMMALKTVSEDEVNEEALSTFAEHESTELKATFEELMQMVDRLPEGYGKVFRLSVFEGLSHKEIAEMLGIEPHSSSSQLARAKKMMRKMIKQYWQWLLIPLLIPVAGIILYYKQRVTDKKTAEIPKTTDVFPSIQPATPSIAHLPSIPSQLAAYDKNKSSSVRISDDLIPDSVPRMVAQQENIAINLNKEQNDTVSAHPIPIDTVSTIFKINTPHYNNIALQRKKIKDYKGWNLFLAYSGSVQGENTRINDYMTIPSLSKGITRSTKIYNWGEYMDYVMNNAYLMDPLTASNMQNMALINSNTPNTPISEKSKHERPLTLQLLLNRQISSLWSFTTGLSLTRMKSYFEINNENTSNTLTLINRTQRINYLGIPLKANFRVVENNRMSIYASGGILLDFPVSARLTTRYVYTNPYDFSNLSQDVTTGIHAPCQLSLGVGLGLQYEILPHINIFLEPSLNYYIPNWQGIETYRTEHQFDISIPVGIKLCW